MPQHEFPTIVFQPFPHGRPKDYQQPGIVDIMLASLPPQVFPSPPPPAPPPPPKVPAKPPTPRVEVEQAFQKALIEEIERLNEPVKIRQQIAQLNLSAVLVKVIPKMEQQILKAPTASGVIDAPLQLLNLTDCELNSH